MGERVVTPTLTLIAPGSSVLISGHDPIIATVVAVTIAGGAEGRQISYRCVWWNGRAHCDEWLDSCLVQMRGKTTTLTIGFHPDPQPRPWISTFPPDGEER